MRLKHVKTALLAATAAVVMTAPPAFAQRTDTRQHTCSDIQATLKHYEVVVLTTGPHTYDRFVWYPNYCQNAFQPQKAWAPSLDSPRCFIGYRCVQNLFD